MEKLDTKSRKKAFDQLFKATIIPFFEKEGFVSVSKTSKKLSKSFLNGLSVYIYFEYKTFGSGFYDLTPRSRANPFAWHLINKKAFTILIKRKNE